MVIFSLEGTSRFRGRVLRSHKVYGASPILMYT